MAVQHSILGHPGDTVGTTILDLLLRALKLWSDLQGERIIEFIIGHREMCGQVVDEFIHVDLTIDIIKHLFKTNINGEFGVPPFPPAGMK